MAAKVISLEIVIPGGTKVVSTLDEVHVVLDDNNRIAFVNQNIQYA